MSGSTTDFETPPGPKWIRSLFGDIAFATVDAVSFNWAENPQPIDPQVLSQFPELKVIWLAGQQVNNETITQCARVPQLRSLNLSGRTVGKVTPSGLSQLSAASKLELLGLFGKWVQDDVLVGTVELRQLKALQLAETPNVTSAIFADIGKLQQLESLVIIRALGINDDGAENLAKLHKLRTLWLMATSIGDPTLEAISNLEQLESLEVSNTKIGDAGVAHLNKLTRLRLLSLAHTQVGDLGIQSLTDLDQVTFLTLTNTQITDESIPIIAGMAELQSLYLDFRSKPRPEKLLQLCALKKLMYLHVAGPEIAPETVIALEKGLPTCTVKVWDESGSGLGPRVRTIIP